ncbi:MAG: hypothetical protein ACTSR8_22495 [Promethearchaeota archaeon]
MSSKIKCPVCGSELKVLNSQHINSKKHQTALKKAGISSSKDPALELISKSKPKKKTAKSISNKKLEQKITDLEHKISELKKNQALILTILESANLTSLSMSSTQPSQQKIQLKASKIKGAIIKCVQNNKNESSWVKIDDVISILKLNREEERLVFKKLLMKMFSRNIVDLAEGGDPKYPLKFQNREYGMIALQ